MFEKKFEIDTITFSIMFRIKSNKGQIYFANNEIIASIELTKPPKLTTLKNGIIAIFAKTE